MEGEYYLSYRPYRIQGGQYKIYNIFSTFILNANQ